MTALPDRDWDRWRQLSCIAVEPVPDKRWSHWHWGGGGSLVRRNLDDWSEVEECGDLAVLEDNLQIEFLEDKSEPEEISSSNRRRHKGEGSGCIYWRTVTRNGKDYQQAYYQYEFWEDGDRLVKSSKYIPKGKLAQVQRLNDQKAPVREILKLLGAL